MVKLSLLHRVDTKQGRETYKLDKAILFLLILNGCALNKKDLRSYEYYFGSEIYNEEWNPIYGYFKAFNLRVNSNNRWEVNTIKGINRDKTMFFWNNGTKILKDTFGLAFSEIDTFRCQFYKRSDTIFQHSFNGHNSILERKIYVESKSDTISTSYIFPKYRDGGYLTVYSGDIKLNIRNKIFECNKVKVFTFPPAAILYSNKSLDSFLIKKDNYKIYYFEKKSHIPIVIQNCPNQNIEAFIYLKNKKRPKVGKIKGCNCD